MSSVVERRNSLEGIDSVAHQHLTPANKSRHIPHLPASFYERSELLSKVRDAGFSRITSPDAVLACLLCRVSASLSPGISIPNGSLNFVAALIGESGTGKSVAFQAARDLLPDIGTMVDGWGIGSGQGIVKTIVGKADEKGHCEIVNSRVLFEADEGEQLLRVGKQDQSITMATIRSAWSGGPLGQTNASEGLTRNVAAGKYRFALLIALQPNFAAELLSGVGGGDPQRFLFMAVQNPNQPNVLPEFPESISPIHLPDDVSAVLVVDPAVTAMITDYRVGKQRGEIVNDPLDSHKHLLTLKTAGLLALLHDDDITIEWWGMARQVVEVSIGVRNFVVENARTQRQSAQIERATTEIVYRAAIDANREQGVLESMLRSMNNFMLNSGGPVNRSALANACAGKHKQVVPIDDAIDEGLKRGQFVRVGGLFGLAARN